MGGPQPGVRRGERLVAHALMLLIALPSVWCIWNAGEIWPWSHYPMYSHVNPPTYRQVTLRGVTADGGEVDLTNVVYWRPFHVNRVRAVFDRLWRRNTRVLRAAPPAAQARVKRVGEQRIRAAAAYFALRYEQGRRAGAHDGPPIRRLLFYENRWQLESWARNRDEPYATKVIGEVDLPWASAPGAARP